MCWIRPQNEYCVHGSLRSCLLRIFLTGQQQTLGLSCLALCVQVCHAAHWKKIILSCLSLCGVRSTLRGLARLSPGAMLLALKLPNRLKDLSLGNHVGLDFEACDCLSDGSWSFDWIRPNSTLYIAPEEHSPSLYLNVEVIIWTTPWCLTNLFKICIRKNKSPMTSLPTGPMMRLWKEQKTPAMVLSTHYLSLLSLLSI